MTMKYNKLLCYYQEPMRSLYNCTCAKFMNMVHFICKIE